MKGFMETADIDETVFSPYNQKRYDEEGTP